MMDGLLERIVNGLNECCDPQYAEALLELAEHNEATIGIEILLDNLYDDELKLSPKLVADIVEFARQVGVASRRYERLAERFL